MRQRKPVILALTALVLIAVVTIAALRLIRNTSPIPADRPYLNRIAYAAENGNVDDLHIIDPKTGSVEIIAFARSGKVLEPFAWSPNCHVIAASRALWERYVLDFDKKITTNTAVNLVSYGGVDVRDWSAVEPYEYVAYGPTWSGDGQQFAFWGMDTTIGFGYFDLFSVSLAGETHNLTSANIYNRHPDWLVTSTTEADENEDGVTITFYGVTPNPLAVNMYVRFPNWSPTSDEIVFSALTANSRDGSSDIYVINADGSNLSAVYFSPNSDDLFPSWSPDGRQIAVLASDGHTNRLLLHNRQGTPKTLIEAWDYKIGRYTWSNDGSRISFTAYFEDDKSEVFVLNIQTGEVEQITNSNMSLNRNPSWSPDDRQIAFEQIVTVISRFM